MFDIYIDMHASFRVVIRIYVVNQGRRISSSVYGISVVVLRVEHQRSMNNRPDIWSSFQIRLTNRGCCSVFFTSLNLY